MADPRFDPFNQAFARRLTQLRESAGLSQSALAERSGMSRTYIYRVESARTLPLLPTAARLARALDMTLSQLLEGLGDSGG